MEWMLGIPLAVTALFLLGGLCSKLNESHNSYVRLLGTFLLVLAFLLPIPLYIGFGSSLDISWGKNKLIELKDDKVVDFKNKTIFHFPRARSAEYSHGALTKHCEFDFNNGKVLFTLKYNIVFQHIETLEAFQAYYDKVVKKGLDEDAFVEVFAVLSETMWERAKNIILSYNTATTAEAAPSKDKTQEDFQIALKQELNSFFKTVGLEVIGVLVLGVEKKDLPTL